MKNIPQNNIDPSQHGIEKQQNSRNRQPGLTKNSHYTAVPTQCSKFRPSALIVVGFWHMVALVINNLLLHELDQFFTRGLSHRAQKCITDRGKHDFLKLPKRGFIGHQSNFHTRLLKIFYILWARTTELIERGDRKSTRLNSSHVAI